MRIRFTVIPAAALAFLAVSGVAQAQTTAPEKRQMTEEQRLQLQQRKQELQQQRQALLEQRREQMQQQREQMRLQREQFAAQRRELMEELKTFQQSLREQVAAGALTREQAQERLRAFREAHKPTPPARPSAQ